MLGLGARHQISLTHLAAAPSSFTRAFALLALQSPCLLPGTMQGLQGKSQVVPSQDHLFSSRRWISLPKHPLCDYPFTVLAISQLRAGLISPLTTCDLTA